MNVALDVSRHRGVSLIEVLIALFVLSVGMLGIGALSLSSLKTNRDALLRTRAVLLANDLADRIRANPEAGETYAASGNGESHACQQTGTTTPFTCTPSQLAEDDKFRWKQALDNTAGGLPSGWHEVSLDQTTAPPTYTITVGWQQLDDPGADASATRVTLRFQR